MIGTRAKGEGRVARGVQHPFVWACPVCRGGLVLGAEDARCEACGVTYACREGIWRFLPEACDEQFATFRREYETVRAAEGWNAAKPEYYRALPQVRDDDPHREIWRRRARSFADLIAAAVAPLERVRHRPLLVLDLGAGNCWLAHRLAERGHRVAAIDLLTNDWDGLGAHTRYGDAAPFTPVQATFARLPFAGAQADLIVFNAALHYAAEGEDALGEALRVLRPDGRLVVMDSPLYRDAVSGEQMVREREARFRRHYGFAADSLGGVGYLTDAGLAESARALRLRWRVSGREAGWRRAARGRWARLRGGRELAAMPVIVGERMAPLHSPMLGGGSRPRRVLARLFLRWRFRLFQRHRYDRLVLETVLGAPILVLPQVFNPVLLRTGAFIAGALDGRTVPQGASVLDLGTGSGVGAVFAARRAGRVVATDINPAAVRCARINVLLNGVECRVEVREGDLFGPVCDERFDVILFNPPYFRGTPRDALDHAWRSNDTVERFAAGLRDHLTPDGHALVVLSTDGDTPAFLRAFAANGLECETIAARDFGNETIAVYRLGVRGEFLAHEPITGDAPDRTL